MLKKGHDIGGTNFKVHLDGYNLLPFLSGKEPCPRDGFIYWSDDGDLMALRVQQYKIVFAEQLATGLQVWREPLKQMRIPKLFDLRSDPFEAGEDSIRYNDWFVEHVPYPVRRAGGRAPVARELQRVPTATKGGELHGRSDRRETDAARLT